MTIKEKINRTFLLLILILRTYKRNISLLWLKIVLFLYTFTAFALIKYLDVIYHGGFSKSFISVISLICLILIEPLNQFTFYYAKKNRKKAKLTKAVVFWLLFTIYCITDIYTRLQAEKTGEWIWAEQWYVIFPIFLFSAYMPWYSFCPDIRYLILVGKFQLYDKKPQTDEQDKVEDKIKK